MTPSRLVAKSSRRWPSLDAWPKRIDIALLSYIALVIAYCDRVNISVAAPSMMREYGWHGLGAVGLLRRFMPRWMEEVGDLAVSTQP
jgi:hypothetical protein